MAGETSSPTRRERAPLAPPLLAAGGAAVAALALHLRDPQVQGSWGFCPFAVLTGGLDCPGCGGLRAVHHLTHGDLLAAASSNLLLVASLPLVVLGWALWLRRAATGRAARLPRPATVWLLAGVLAVAVTGFAVLRNLPVGSWLHS